MIPAVLKNFSLFVDGKGYAGQVEEIVLPKLTRKMQEHRAGGMNGPVELDYGLEKLEASFTLSDYNKEVLSLFGAVDNAKVPLRFKGAVEQDDEDGSVTAVEVVLNGRWRELDMGSWKGGDKAVLKVGVAASYYKYTQAGEDLIEIDVVNMIEKIGGVDRLAAQRAALGL
ncbi:phage major tail tube protein [Desulfuromonas thiophila]|uniref:phage major tail tube protein n=1 Tax=Desulfuromonas thiophila TaxID=57664 RepID=UPI0029F5182A|nr:phage major tail tube protein [Desulfuromonas thiophila]